jgi:hypothetical protein
MIDFGKQTSRPTAKHRDGPGPGACDNKSTRPNKYRTTKPTLKRAIEQESKTSEDDVGVAVRWQAVELEHMELAAKLLREMELEPVKENAILEITSSKNQSAVDDNDDFCFLAGGWDPKPSNGDQGESAVLLDPVALPSSKNGIGTHLSVDQVALATAALGKFVAALFDRSLNAFQTNKAAEHWCVCRGMPASKGPVVLSVARHLKEVVSPHNRRERSVEISQRLEQTFPKM